jgi:hypothetical protein
MLRHRHEGRSDTIVRESPGAGRFVLIGEESNPTHNFRVSRNAASNREQARRLARGDFDWRVQNLLPDGGRVSQAG